MGSNFRTTTHRVIHEYGMATIRYIQDIMLKDDVPEDVRQGALMRIGDSRDMAPHDARLTILERALESKGGYTRDAALIGIDAMNDAGVIPSLENACRKERVKWFKQYIRDVVTSLKMQNRQSDK